MTEWQGFRGASGEEVREAEMATVLNRYRRPPQRWGEGGYQLQHGRGPAVPTPGKSRCPNNIAPRASRETTLDLHNTRPVVGNMRESAEAGGLLCGCSQKFREGVLVVAGLIAW